MKSNQIETITPDLFFTMEHFMVLTQCKRLDSKTAQLVDEYVERWRPQLQVRKITADKKGYLLAWLEEPVEQEVNSIWETSPSKAFSLNGLGQAMLMALVQDLIPEVAYFGCAPVPKPTAALRAALEETGVAWDDKATLSRQYAMLTYIPFEGGCEICLLKEECPKVNLSGS